MPNRVVGGLSIRGMERVNECNAFWCDSNIKRNIQRSCEQLQLKEEPYDIGLEKLEAGWQVS